MSSSSSSSDGADAEVDTSAPPPSRADLSHYYARATPSEGHVTETWLEQRATEQRVFQASLSSRRVLARGAHAEFVRAGLRGLDGGYAALHASQPWLLFWMLHALDVLGERASGGEMGAAVEWLRRCRDPGGGFGGGPGQEPHLASTYAAVAALVVVGTEEAFEVLRGAGVGRFVREMKCEDGGFRISRGGEKDVRAVYSALAAASMAGVLDGELTRAVGAYVRGNVSFDGGVGGEPGNEAHGGNTYCGVAAAALAGALGELDVGAVVDWAAMRQCRLEGGFCGRANKLVDSCYSFWVGALFPIAGAPRAFNAPALQDYILGCCQGASGGLRDKPGVAVDFHHTCYALSGLSVAQHYGGADPPPGSAVEKIDPLHNVRVDRLRAVRAWNARNVGSEQQ